MQDAGTTTKTDQMHCKFISITLLKAARILPRERHTNRDASTVESGPCSRITKPALFSCISGIINRSSLPLRFELYRSKAGMSSMFNGVVLSLAQAYVQMYCLSNTQD